MKCNKCELTIDENWNEEFCPYCSERLEWVEGGGAADCSAGREADKGQADAEEAKPGSAALIPPAEAEAEYLKLIENWRAKSVSQRGKYKKMKKNGVITKAWRHKRSAHVYARCADKLEEKLAENRKASIASGRRNATHHPAGGDAEPNKTRPSGLGA